MQLYIGNKNYSSWSMRAWVLLRQLEIPFEEMPLRFDGFGPESNFKRQILKISPVGRVPVLVDGPLVVWDTLAITETVAERFADKAIWPCDPMRRARARSLCAEMHGGFGDLRNHCPMNIDVDMTQIGQRLMLEQAGLRSDLARVVQLMQQALQGSGGPFLFGEFTAADAFYVPVLSRIRTYALPIPDDVQAYSARVFATSAVSEWVSAALLEKDFVAEDELYRTSRD